MARATDEELEAMAQRLTVLHPAVNQVVILGETANDAAAMLRACKGRVKPLPRADGEGGWTLPVDLLAEIRDEVYANEWDAPCAEVIEIIALSTETRILAALDPASGYLEGWNDAREAAACYVGRALDALTSGPFDQSDPRIEALSEYADAIRALTPPERPKP